MLAQLILALYNVVDSYFVGHYSDDGLTALSVIYPIQLCITALAVGSIGVFLEGGFTKVHQASGNRKLPTIAQVVGALINIVLDPLLFSLALMAVIPDFGDADDCDRAYLVLSGLCKTLFGKKQFRKAYNRS